MKSLFPAFYHCLKSCKTEYTAGLPFELHKTDGTVNQPFLMAAGTYRKKNNKNEIPSEIPPDLYRNFRHKVL